MTSNDWIKQLNPGDSVIIRRGGVYQGERIAVVDRVTPSGRIVCNKTTFNPDGWERGNNDWNRSHIAEATPDLIEKIRVKEILARARHVAGKIYGGEIDITVEQAEQILSMIENNA